MSNDCLTCLYGKSLHVAAHAAERVRCFRPRMMVDGSFVECGRNGFDADDERGTEAQAGRLPGDLCSPTGKHWRPQP